MSVNHPLVDELDALLCGLWPGQLRALLDPEDPKPLAIGIGNAIADQLAMTPAEHRRLGILLGRWCARMAYLKALRRQSAMRFDLDGHAVELVSREHEIAARQRIYRKRLARERRQAEHDRKEAEAAREASRCRANAGLPVLRLRP